MTRRGRFLSFEGPEGSGKSTQARRLVAHLEALGHAVLYTREPGGTPLGEAVRELLQHAPAGQGMSPVAETLLFEASRAELVRTVVRPALATGRHVVCDRFMDSTTAYQGYARGLDVEGILALHAFAVGDAVPDRTLLVDVTVELGFARLRERYGADGGPDRFEREARAFHEAVRAGYLALARRWPARIRVVDGAGTADAVAARVWEAAQDLFVEAPP